MSLLSEQQRPVHVRAIHEPDRPGRLPEAQWPFRIDGLLPSSHQCQGNMSVDAFLLQLRIKPVYRGIDETRQRFRFTIRGFYA